MNEILYLICNEIDCIMVLMSFVLYIEWQFFFLAFVSLMLFLKCFVYFFLFRALIVDESNVSKEKKNDICF